jgi:uncharacterized membrane protein/Leucine-rich repeat (LRR) protein
MKRLIDISKSITLFFLFLTTFLFAFADRIVLPVWLQVAGKLHPLILHLPIGITVLILILVLLRSQFESEQFKKLITYSLLITTLTSSITVFFGLLLSLDGEYGFDALQRHKVSGLIIGWLSYVALIFYQSSFKKKALKHGIISVFFVLLIFVGHTGAELTHGENFVLSPLQAAEPTLNSENASGYQLAVMPILEKKCFSCHNESKTKGKLLMTVADKFKKGGESGLAFIAGNPDSSRMIQYIHLPLKDDDHMPPAGKTQLTEFEITLLEAWIKSGADFTKKLAEFSLPDTFVTLANQAIKSKLQPEKVEYNFESVSTATLKNLNTPFRTIFPVYAKSPALEVNFFVSDYFKIEALKELTEINKQIVTVNLSKMPVTDDDLKVFSDFENLEVLNLNFTKLTGPGIANLKSCKNLKSVSLAGTKITSESLLPLLTIPSLNSVYIWNTSITDTQKTDLEKKYPKVNFLLNQFKDESMIALSRPNLINEGILEKEDKIELKHNMLGVTIRYTIDGTQPDSVTGLIYKQPIAINESIKLKAIACKSGWYCSPLFESSVYLAGVKPEQVKLLKSTHKKYPGTGAISLTDGVKGYIEEFKSPDWLGFIDTDFEASFDFGKNATALNKVVVSYGDYMSQGIFPPTELQIWGGTQGNFKLLATQKLPAPKAYNPLNVSFITASWQKSIYNTYKVIVKPNGKVPEWHGARGQKGWLFVDEVLFY